jgi:hypothetical protein
MGLMLIILLAGVAFFLWSFLRDFLRVYRLRYVAPEAPENLPDHQTDKTELNNLPDDCMRFVLARALDREPGEVRPFLRGVRVDFSSPPPLATPLRLSMPSATSSPTYPIFFLLSHIH